MLHCICYVYCSIWSAIKCRWKSRPKQKPNSFTIKPNKSNHTFISSLQKIEPEVGPKLVLKMIHLNFSNCRSTKSEAQRSDSTTFHPTKSTIKPPTTKQKVYFNAGDSYKRSISPIEPLEEEWTATKIISNNERAATRVALRFVKSFLTAAKSSSPDSPTPAIAFFIQNEVFFFFFFLLLYI